jgi:hypothetical protein
MRTLHIRPARVPPRTQPSAATAEPDMFTCGYLRRQRALRRATADCLPAYGRVDCHRVSHRHRPYEMPT